MATGLVPSQSMLAVPKLMASAGHGMPHQSVIDRLEHQHRQAQYSSLTLNEIDSLCKRAALFLDVETPDNDDVMQKFMLLCRKYLGDEIRLLSDGSVIGERALDGQLARTANAVCVTGCELITLGVSEYISLVKNAAKQKRTLRFRSIYDAFDGAQRLKYEVFWQFQYNFIKGSDKEGSFLSCPSRLENRTYLIWSGVCEIYITKHKNSLHQFDAAINDLDEYASFDNEFIALLQEIRKEIGEMPEASQYLLGYIGPGQLANLESLFTESGSSFFTYKVKSKGIEYFEIDKYMPKMPYFCGEIRSIAFGRLKGLLEYRLEYLRKKNVISDPENARKQARNPLQDFSHCLRLSKMLKRECRLTADEYLDLRSDDRAAKKDVQENAKSRPTSNHVHTTNTNTKAVEQIINGFSAMNWKRKAKSALQREASLSNQLAIELKPQSNTNKKSANKSTTGASFTCLFHTKPGQNKPTSSLKQISKGLSRELTLNIAKRQPSEATMATHRPLTAGKPHTAARDAATMPIWTGLELTDLSSKLEHATHGRCPQNTNKRLIDKSAVFYRPAQARCVHGSSARRIFTGYRRHSKSSTQACAYRVTSTDIKISAFEQSIKSHKQSTGDITAIVVKRPQYSNMVSSQINNRVI